MKFGAVTRAIVEWTLPALGALTRDFRSVVKRASAAVDRVRSTARAQTPILIERLRIAARDLRARSGALALSFFAHARVAWVATRAAAVTAVEVLRHRRATVVPRLAGWWEALSSAAVRAVIGVA